MKQAIKVKTQAEYDKLMRVLEDRGIKWRSGHKPTEKSYFGKDEKLCVDIDDGCLERMEKSWYQRAGWEIISLSEYLRGEQREFKVGDKVKIISKTMSEYEADLEYIKSCYPDGTGRITEIHGDGSGRDEENCLEVNGNYFTPQDLEKIEPEEYRMEYSADFNNLIGFDETISQKPKTMLNRLTSKIKRIFKENLRKQYRAQYIDECGALTSEGQEELDDIVRDAFDAQLTERAEAKIKEAKEDK